MQNNSYETSQARCYMSMNYWTAEIIEVSNLLEVDCCAKYYCSFKIL